jgi:hypothetical protein
MGMRGGSRSCANSDDLVLALAIAVWRADGGGIASWGIFELTRRQAEQAGGPTVRAPRYYVGVVRLWFVMLRNGRRRVDPAHDRDRRRVAGFAPDHYARGSIEWQEEQRRRQSAGQSASQEP